MSKANPRVAVARREAGEPVRDVAKRLFRLLDWPPSGGLHGSVVIKPNLLVLQSAATGATTTPELVHLIVEMCQEAGASEVTVAESSNWGVDTDAMFKGLGYAEIARKTGCKLLNLKTDELEPVDVPGLLMQRFLVSRTLHRADYVINVPVMKSHRMTYVTFGLKNIAVGTMIDDQKEVLHRIGLYPALSDEVIARGSGLDHNIVAINMAYRCDLTVVDGLVGQEGPGAPLTGLPVNAGVLVAGFDRVGVDAVASKAIGVEPSSVPHLVLAAEAGLGELDTARLSLVGQPLEGLTRPFQSAIDLHPEAYARPGVEIVVGRACYACLGDLSYFLQRHMSELQQLAPLTIVVGKVGRPKFVCDRRRIAFYGNCAGEYLYGGGFIPGCPPRSRRQVFQALGGLDLYSADEGVALNR